MYPPWKNSFDNFCHLKFIDGVFGEIYLEGIPKVYNFQFSKLIWLFNNFIEEFGDEQCINLFLYSTGV